MQYSHQPTPPRTASRCSPRAPCHPADWGSARRGCTFELIPIDRGVPSGFKVSSFRRQRVPVSVSAGVGKGSSQRPELGSRPGFLEIRHRNFPQWLRAGGGPLCLRSRMPSSGEPPAGDPRSARACGTDRSPPPWRSPPLLAPLPPPSPFLLRVRQVAGETW